MTCGAASAQVITTATLTVTQAGTGVTSVAPTTPVTLTATVTTGGADITPGQVTFCDANAVFCTDIHAIGTVQLSNSGTAKLTLLPGAAGAHSYQARFLGTVSAAASASNVVQVSVAPSLAPPANSVTALSASGSPGNYTLTATVMGNGTAAPSGAVSFVDATNSGYVLRTATLGTAAAGLSYTMGNSYATGFSVDEIAVGDFNGDGFPDIVTMNGLNSGTMTVLMNKGDGTFTTLPSFAGTTDTPTSLAVGDFNGDGHLDIAIGDAFAGMLTILVGNGDGTFQRGVTTVLPVYSSVTSTGIYSIGVGDFNRDGIADLAVVDPWSQTLRVLLGKGDGTFTIQAAHPATGINPLDIAVGDFNGDGKLDLIVCNAFGPGYSSSATTLNVFLGNGDGTFNQAADVAISGGAEQIFAGDFDSDGKLDLAVNHSAAAPSVFEVLSGNGDGTFTARTSPQTLVYLQGIGIGDLNGDGRPDFGGAFDQTSNNVAGLIGNGDGMFTVTQPGTDSWQIPSIAVVADFKGVGYGEIAIANQQNGLTIMEPHWIGTATATATGISPVGSGTHYAYAVYGGDANYAGSTSNQVPLAAQRVVTALALTASFSVSAPGQAVTFVATLDKSGAQNHTATQNVTFFSNGVSVGAAAVTNGVATVVSSTLAVGTDSLTASYAGDTTFAPSTSGSVSHTVMPQSSGLATATALTITTGGAAVSSVPQGTAVTLTAVVTAAGVPVSPGQVRFCDATAASCTGAHLLGTSALTSAGTATLTLKPGLGSHLYKAVFAGTNSRLISLSGVASLAVTGATQLTVTSLATTGVPGNYTLTATVTGPALGVPTGQVSFQDLTNASYVLGTATLSGGSAVWSATNLGMPGTVPVPYGIAIADFNGDGIADMAVADAQLNHVVLWLGNGDGTFRQGQTIATQTEPTAVVAADFNADGKLDLVVACNYGGGLSVLLGNGDGTFAPATTVPAGNYPASVAVGDFDGDGRLDLAVPDYVGNTVTILLGNGDASFHQLAQVPVAGGPQAVVTADLNGDGKADLMIGTLLTSRLVELLGNGDGTFTAAATSPGSNYTGEGFASLAIGDFNGDGIEDVAFPSQDSSVGVLLGKGDGTFTVAPAISTGFISESVAIGDLNGDGIQDVVVGVGDLSGSNYAVALLGKGDGTFLQSTTAPTGKQPGYSAVGDLNGDGLADAVTANSGSGNLTLLFSATTASATITGISPVGTGTHLVDAVYAGDASFTGSTSNTVPLIAQPQSTTLSLIASSASSVAGQGVTLTATVSPSTAQNHAATQNITFLSNGASVGTAMIVNGQATLVVSTLAVGTDTLTATYSGDTNFAPATSGSVPHIVTQPTLATQAITFPQPLTPVNAGTSLLLTASASSGLAVTFSVLSGPATISGQTLSFTGPGTVLVAADQAGNASYSPAPEVVRSITVIASLASITLGAAPNPVFQQSPLVLTAVLSGPLGLPSGTVTFFDGSLPLGQATVTTGSATFTTSSLSLGTHSITATYGGNSSYPTVVSAVVLVTVQDFAFTATSPHVTIFHGGTATYSLVLSTSGGLGMASTVNFSVSGAPDYSKITFTPPSVQAGSGTTPVTLVIQTPNFPAGSSVGSTASKTTGISLAVLALGGLLLPPRRKQRKTITQIRRLSCAMLLVIGVFGVGLTGCGSGWRQQDWTINVIASSGNLSRTATLYLTSQCEDQEQACPIK
jgi:Bacterial Ig-like domain (group 3)/FG-GAP-like repeat